MAGGEHGRLTRGSCIKWKQKGVVVGRRAQAVDEVREEADDDDAGVESRKVDDVMELQIIDDQQVAGLEAQVFRPHAEAGGSVQRKKKFEAFVPGLAPRVMVGGEMKEFDEQREFRVQCHLVPPARVHLRGDVVSFKQLRSRAGQQVLPGVGRTAHAGGFGGNGGAISGRPTCSCCRKVSPFVR